MKQKIDNFRTQWNNSTFGKLVQRHPRRSEFIAVGVFFALLAALFMGPILWHFSSAVHGFWGDGTGGLIWLNSLNLGPFGGITDAIIYPYGDNLFRPEFITAMGFVLPIWILTKLIGAVAAWNAVIFISFWLCGVSMYYLAKRLSGSPQAALWAGVAFAYMPMHQYKAFGHIAYILTFVFVFVFWHLLNFIERPSKKTAAILGLVFAVPFYVDGYYVLFTLLLVGVPLLFLLGKQIWQLNKQTATTFKRFLGHLCIFIGTAGVALLPVLYTKVVYGAQIASSLAMARGDFMSNVMVYTARWYDFVIPIETHPVFGQWATAFRVAHNHGSNTSEHTLYVGFVVLGLVAWLGYYLWKQRKNRKAAGLPVRRQALLILLLVAFVAFLISLPPYFHLFGHKIPMPSGVVSVLVQYWRVYARLILIVHLMLVLVGAVGLALLLKRAGTQARMWALTSLLILVTFFEYLSFNPFKRQDIWYYDKLSTANTWLTKQKDIRVIAVYPLVDQPNGLASLYTTEQRVNGKKMINSGTVSAKGARLRASITGLQDPQTLSVLKALGAQAIMTHEVPADRQVSKLRLAYSASTMPAGYAADVDVYRIADDVLTARYALVADEGFKDVIDMDLKTKYYINPTGASLKVAPMPGVAEQAASRHRIQFDITSTAAYAGNDVAVMQGDKVIDVIKVAAGQTLHQSYEVSEGHPVKLVIAGQLKADTLYLQNIRVE